MASKRPFLEARGRISRNSDTYVLQRARYKAHVSARRIYGKHMAVSIQAAKRQEVNELSSTWRKPMLDPDTGQRHSVCVALGKFDAMHIGHRLLVEETARMGGYPCMLSFAGIAKELNLPVKKPLTAAIDRDRILQSWAVSCGGKPPVHVNIPFAEIRTLRPEEFIDILVDTFDVMGVVVGANYRFGYKAMGDASLLKRVGTARGLLVEVVELKSAFEANLAERKTGARQQLTSSSVVREHLRLGEVEKIEVHLDRPYALVVPARYTNKGLQEWSFLEKESLTALPCVGVYDAELFATAETQPLCKGTVHIGLDGVCTVRHQEIRLPLHSYLRLELISAVERKVK